MTAPSVSVVLCSRGRPADLALCLDALRYQGMPFEVVVVADAAGRAAAAGFPVRTIGCDVANLSVARNEGIRAARGEIVAFIDDDAVAEPQWLAALVAPFAGEDVAAAGGFVLGRNGISLQWGGRRVDGWARHADVAAARPWTVLPPPAGGAIRTEGTSMAVRRTVLERLGGFDPGYAFYLDDTDLDMRLAARGAAVALAPAARVLHRQSASAERDGDRVPRRLDRIGASLGRFLRRWAPEAELSAAMAHHAAEQRARLLRHLRAGRLGRADATRLMAEFARALLAPEAGEADPASLAPAPPAPPLPYPQLPPRTGQDYLLALSSRRHRRAYLGGGRWLQTGGLWGRSFRDDPPVSPWSRAGRIAREEARLAVLQGQEPWPCLSTKRPICH